MARNNKNRIARLKEENEELKKDLRRAEYSLDLATDTSKYMLNRLQSDNENLKELNEKLDKAVHKLFFKNVELRRKLNEQKPSSGIDYAKHCKLIAVCGKQKEEIGRLKNEIAKLKEENNKKRIDNNKLVAENVELNVKIQQMAKPIPLIDTLHVEIAKLKDDLRIEKDGRKGLFEEKESLKTKNERLTEEIKNLKIDKEYDKHSAEDLHAIATEQGKLIDELKEKVKDLESKAIENQQELIAAYDKINKLKEELSIANFLNGKSKGK